MKAAEASAAEAEAGVDEVASSEEEAPNPNDEETDRLGAAPEAAPKEKLGVPPGRRWKLGVVLRGGGAAAAEEDGVDPKEVKEKGAGEAGGMEEVVEGELKEKGAGLGIEAAGESEVGLEVDSERTEVMKEPAVEAFLGVDDPFESLVVDELPKGLAGEPKEGAMLVPPLVDAVEEAGAPNEKPPVDGLGDEVLAVDAPPNENPPAGADPDEVEGKVEKGEDPVEVDAGASSLAPPNENPVPPDAKTGGALGFSVTTSFFFSGSEVTS